jgi:hypothetical protein
MSENPTTLEGVIVTTAALSPADHAAMRALMDRHFRDLDPGQFARDLAEKPWTILLRDAAGDLAGFSTLDVMTATITGREVRAVYSGDTIIDSRHRMTAALPRAFLRFLARHTGVGRDAAAWYWFYVCKGYRTYRFLPVFYHTFHPHPAAATPDFEQRVMDHLARARFGAAYDPATGIVRVPGDYALREGIGDLSPERLADPYIRYFAGRNPGWAGGDELVCLAALNRGNLLAKPLQWLDQELSA